MQVRWSTRDYDILFANHPPTHARAPTLIEARRIADRLRRSTGAVRTQWDDARSLVLGNPTAASLELRSFVAERWLREQPAADVVLMERLPGRLR
jgi:hypothetical protein